jgi:hypothetical protein
MASYEENAQRVAIRHEVNVRMRAYFDELIEEPGTEEYVQRVMAQALHDLDLR